MRQTVGQWLVVAAFLGVFIIVGVTRFHLKYVTLSIVLLLPYCFGLVIILYHLIKKEDYHK